VQHRRAATIIKGVRKQVLVKVLQGTADSNIRFDDLRSLLAALGFSERVRGSHHIFTRPDVVEILNVQPRGSLAKAYQVKQVRTVIVRYKLAEGAQ
jgi:predicted RNA binding protein YcfA (HicA-like mRNA interferase family)